MEEIINQLREIAENIDENADEHYSEIEHLESLSDCLAHSKSELTKAIRLLKRKKALEAGEVLFKLAEEME
jgi:prefoldin subunit 5